MCDFLQLCEYLHCDDDEQPDFYNTSESEVYDYAQGNGGVDININVLEAV